MELIDMKRSKSEMEEGKPEVAYEESQYPYGLKIHLCKEEVDKLGLSNLPGVGDKFKMYAVVEVCDVSNHKTEHGENKSIGLQIKGMSLELKSEDKSTEKVLYEE